MAMLETPSKVGLLQISNGLGGSELRMAKYAVELARTESVRPILLINEALANAYKSRDVIHRALAEADVEIRILDQATLRLITWGVALKTSGPSSISTLVRLAGAGWTKVFPPYNLLAPIIRDVDVLHGFYGKESLAAFLTVVETWPKITLHEVTSHRVIPAYVRVLAGYARPRGQTIHLRCVSETVKRDLEAALQQKHPGLIEKKNVELSVSTGPFVGILGRPEKGRRLRKIVFGHRLQPSKNGLVFAQAVARIIEDGLLPEWEFCIFGRGKDEGAIRQILAGPLAEGRVTVGWTDNLEAELSSSAIFVSIIETGNYPAQSVFEALGHGNILCLSDTGVTRDKFGDVPGVTFYCSPERDSVVEAICSAASQLESHGFERTEAAARRHFEVLQASSGHIGELLSIYKVEREVRNVNQD